MNDSLQDLMRAATRLTQAGHLQQATAAIQRALGRALPAGERGNANTDREAGAQVLDGCVFERDPGHAPTAPGAAFADAAPGGAAAQAVGEQQDPSPPSVAMRRAGRAAVHRLPGLHRAFHYGEESDKGFLVWQVDADGADCMLHPTPARRTVDICFEGKPALDEPRAAVAQQGVAGAFIRLRWTIAEEDRHEVDRAAICCNWPARPRSSSRAASCRWCAPGLQASRRRTAWPRR